MRSWADPSVGDVPVQEVTGEFVRKQLVRATRGGERRLVLDLVVVVVRHVQQEFRALDR